MKIVAFKKNISYSFSLFVFLIVTILMNHQSGSFVYLGHLSLMVFLGFLVCLFFFKSKHCSKVNMLIFFIFLCFMGSTFLSLSDKKETFFSLLYREVIEIIPILIPRPVGCQPCPIIQMGLKAQKKEPIIGSFLLSHWKSDASLRTQIRFGNHKLNSHFVPEEIQPRESQSLHYFRFA